jgi:hypothetical protein
MVPMTNTEPDVRRAQIRWPNEVGANPNVVRREVEQAALREASSTVAPGEQVVYLQVEGGVAERGNDAVMVWSYSYQVLRPGGQAVRR